MQGLAVKSMVLQIRLRIEAINNLVEKIIGCERARGLTWRQA